MSITDAPTQKSLTDVYPEGTPFIIQRAWFEGVVPTQFGDRSMAKVLVTPIGGGSPQEFAVWGSLCEQVQQVEEGEIPGAFFVAKEGKRYLFKAATGVQTDGQDDLAAAEAAGDVPQAQAQAQAAEPAPAAVSTPTQDGAEG